MILSTLHGIISNADAGKEKNGKKSSILEWEWDRTFWESLKSGNYRYIDLGFYRKIKNSPFTRKICRIIDKKFAYKSVAQIPVKTLIRDIGQFGHKKVNTDYHCQEAIAPHLDYLYKLGFLETYGFLIDKGNVMVKMKAGDKIPRLDLSKKEKSILEA